MLAGDFYRKLKKLNKRLYIYCEDWDTRPASICHYKNGEFEKICGIDKHYIPQYAIMADHGAHIKGGWRRALRILITKGLIRQKQAEQVFKTKLGFIGRKLVKRDDSIPAQLLS